jgi:hypothetical protein
MLRLLSLLLALTMLPLLADEDIRPVISIASPDTATTFAFGTISKRALVWSESAQTLFAEITFVDVDPSNNQSNDDTHRFRLPGITLDKAHGVFYATSPKGEVIPIARRKKALFLTTIEVLPNAIVRVNHRHGDVSVILEAIRPDDVAKLRKAQAARAAQANPDSDTGHTINIQDLLP